MKDIIEILKEQRLMYPAVDDVEFNILTEHLPKWGNQTTMHCSNVSLQCFRLLGSVCEPDNVLEIGFNLGHSCTMLLEVAGARYVTSVDINSAPDVLLAAGIIDTKYPKSFHLITGSSSDPEVQKRIRDLNSKRRFDVVFVDGDHSVEGVDSDVQLALSLKPNFIFFDDFHPHWGPGTIPAIINYNLKVIAIQGNMCLCSPPAGYIVRT